MESESELEPIKIRRSIRTGEGDGEGVDATPQIGFVSCTPPLFEAGDLIFAIAAFLTFYKVFRKFQESRTFGS